MNGWMNDWMNEWMNLSFKDDLKWIMEETRLVCILGNIIKGS